jgi:hypothetical protein
MNFIFTFIVRHFLHPRHFLLLMLPVGSMSCQHVCLFGLGPARKYSSAHQ